MQKLIELGSDMAALWGEYWKSYLNGIANTLILALVATVIGCLIGFVCGILQTIPHSKSDPPVKRFFLALIRVIVRVYVEVFRGTPMILQAVFVYYALPYFTNNQVRFSNVWLAAIVVVSINTGAYMAESVRGGILSIDPGQTEGAKAIGMNHFQTMRYVILPQAYLCMTLTASFILRWVEKKMDGSDNYELVKEDQLVLTSGTYNHPQKGSPFDEKSKEYRDRLEQDLKHGRNRGER